MSNGGRGEIRTHGRRKTSAVFKTAAINRALPPFRLSMTVAAMPRGKRCIYVSRIKCKAVEALPPPCLTILSLILQKILQNKAEQVI